MPRSLLWPDPRVKPPYGAAEIDWGHPLAETLAVCWLFNEGGGITVMDKIHATTGTLTNTPVWTAGAPGPVLNFVAASSQYLTVPTISFAPNGACTISTRISDLFTAGSFLADMADSGASGRIVLSTVGGNWGGNNKALSIYDNTAISNLGAVNSISSGWHALSVSASAPGNLSTGYVDGIATGTGTKAAQSAFVTLKVATRNTAVSAFWSGQIENFIIHNSVLSSGLVAWLHAEPYAMLRPIVRRRYFVFHKVGPLIHAANPQLITAGGSLGGATL